MEDRYIVEIISNPLDREVYAVAVNGGKNLLVTFDKEYALDLCQALNTARFNRLHPDDGK